ncbi:hypothetical protein BH10CHL1_BH10CHL1_22490 [soil metagenome]
MQPKIIFSERILYFGFFLIIIYSIVDFDRIGNRYAMAQINGPILTIPAGIVASDAETVTVPLNLSTNGVGIAAIVASIDFDETCLSFDASDHNGDLRPDNVHFNMPAQMSSAVSYDPADTQGELDFVIADYAPPITSLPDRNNLVTIIFTTTCTPAPGQMIVAPIKFSKAPAPSFSDPEGHRVSGMTTNGAVEIHNDPATASPTVNPSFTPTPIAIITPATTPVATITPTVLVTGTITAQTGGTLKTGNVQLSFPPGAVTKDIVIVYQEQPLSSPPPGAFLRGIELNAYTLDTNEIVTNFTLSFTLVISYTPADLIEAGITDETKLWLYYRSSQDQPWQPTLHCAGCGPDLQTHTFTMILNHFTQFSLTGDSANNKWMIFLPVIQH